MFRAILAVIAGYAIMFIAVLALFGIVLSDPEAVPKGNFMMFSLLYGFLFAIAGGYVAAMIGAGSEMRHALYLAAFSTVLGIISIIATAGQEPLWYQISNAFILIAGVTLGGYLRMQQVARAGR